MTRTAEDGMILTIIGKPDEDKERCEWAHSVTSTDGGCSEWEQVEYARFAAWQETHPEPEPEPIV